MSLDHLDLLVREYADVILHWLCPRSCGAQLQRRDHRHQKQQRVACSQSAHPWCLAWLSELFGDLSQYITEHLLKAVEGMTDKWTQEKPVNA